MNDTEKKYREAIDKANAAKNDTQFSEAVASLIEISDVFPKAAFEVYMVLKRCGYTEYAYFYLQLAAVQNFEKARVVLGKCLAEGIYFERNEKKAIELLSEYPNNASALCGLGFIYVAGKQIPQDQQKAVALFAKSAGMGYAQASYNIALICAGYTGLKRNEKQMFDWLNTAISQGNGDACFYAAREYSSKGMEKKALSYLYQGVKLGHKGCIEVYSSLRQQISESSAVYQSGIYQSQENEAEFSYTGQADIVHNAEAERAEAIRRRSKSMDAAAAYSGGGFVDYETGFIVDRNGNTIVTDESGFSYSENGAMLYDEDSGFLFSNRGTAFFDENMQTMYDMQKEKWSMIFKI
ncbi:MAG: sel1 repeat family protein [Bacteroides sp.]|nr:sel1 repeat family protein [Bacteroides sp.]